MKILMTSVFVHDPNEAFKFYTETLGFEKRMHMPEAHIAIVVSPEDPKGTSLLLEHDSSHIASTYQEGLYQKGIPAITMGVPDVQKEYEKLKGKGVKFTKEPVKTEWGIEAVFDDTCGNLIQLFQIE